MKYFFYCLLGIVFLSGCTAHTPVVTDPTPEVEKEVVKEKEEVDTTVYIEAETAKRVSEAPLVPQTPMTIIGETEPVFLTGFRQAFAARIDTGATTSSVHAEEISLFERDGKSWVNFTVINDNNGERVKMQKPISRKVSIKRHGEEPQQRIVVKLNIKIGGKEYLREFSLTDRGDFEYPVLIGRNILSGFFVVDVSQENVTSLMKEAI